MLALLTDDENPIWIVPSSPFYVSILPNGLTKSQSEDLQILDWLSFMSGYTAIESPIGVTIGNDPPDRYLITPKGKMGVELRQLTLPIIRQELAPLRDYGQSLQVLINDLQAEFLHLLGRRLHLILMETKNSLPRNLSANTHEILNGLREDKGVVGEDLVLNPDGSFPSRWPDTHRGFYGQIGHFFVQVESDGIPNNVIVSCGTQTQVRLSEAIDAVNQAVQEKDIPGNDDVLITCGLPDTRGFQCPLDIWLYDHIMKAREQIAKTIQSPKFIKCVIIRMWNSNSVFELYRNPNSILPWRAY